MIPHCTSAALVSENKTLCFPSSADTQSTSAGKEDHVSMGGWSARKALKVVKNLENVLAIELLAACQALEFKRPHHTTEPLEAVSFEPLNYNYINRIVFWGNLCLRISDHIFQNTQASTHLRLFLVSKAKFWNFSLIIYNRGPVNNNRMFYVLNSIVLRMILI